MNSHRLSAIVLVLAAQSEPAPRHLAATDIRLPATVATVSGVHELRDGRLLLSDATSAAVFALDRTSGAAKQIGSAGGGPTQYAQPGGFYRGAADTTYLLDRGVARFLVISPLGEIVGARSIKMNGRSGSSSDDVDHQHVDASGHAYFEDFAIHMKGRVSGRTTDSLPLLRFDAARQHAETVAMLRRAEIEQTVDGNMTYGRAIFGSPADGWGAAPDGRVAIVQAAPYRVSWYSPSGQVVRGTAIDADLMSFTPADISAIASRQSKAGGGVSVAGAAGGGPAVVSEATKPLLADHMAPFAPADVIVSPDGMVWVSRTQHAGATSTIYDVFDKHGERIDRVELGAHEHIVGFATGAIYTMGRDAANKPALHRYKL